MTGVRDALADYLQLRRRLGFEMPQDGRLLEGFVTFLEAAGAERISTIWRWRGHGHRGRRTRLIGVSG